MMDLLENICFIDCNFTRNATPYGLWLSILMDLGAIAGLTTVALTVQLSQTRIFYAMAHDGLLPPFFARIHRSTETPWISTIVSGRYIYFYSIFKIKFIFIGRNILCCRFGYFSNRYCW
jgi:amino acid transporter